MGSLPRVRVLATGGTIASKAAGIDQTHNYASPDFGAQELIDLLPGIEKIAGLEYENIASLLSCDIGDRERLSLSACVNETFREGFDGVVITHGTDTMEETAFFLHHTADSDRPVVLTGAMRPRGVLSHDGPLNLWQAVVTAAAPQSRGYGALICMNDMLLDAEDVLKCSTFRTGAFDSPFLGPAGFIEKSVPRFCRLPKPRRLFHAEGRNTLPRVEAGWVHAGCLSSIESIAATRPDGLILICPGSGSLPQALKEWCRGQQGMPIVRSSRIPAHPVPEGVDVDDIACGTAAAGVLPPQKARLYLQLLLTVTRDMDEIRAAFREY